LQKPLLALNHLLLYKPLQKYMRHYLTYALMCIWSLLSAQVPSRGSQDTSEVRNQDSVSLSDLRLLAEPDDTTVFSYYLLSDLGRPIIAADTLADDAWRLFDPVRSANGFDQGNLGNSGSAARPLWFLVKPRLGFDLGYHAFDLYKALPDSIRFVKNERSFTDITYYQGRSQSESALKARFGRTFQRGANLVIEYKNINHKGQYLYQQAKHNALQFGLWYPFSSRYTGVVTYGRNTHEQEENGGIVSDTLFGQGPLSGPLNLPIRLSKQVGGTRYSDQTLRYVQILQLVGKADKTGLQLRHSAEYQNANYKFNYKLPNGSDSLIYPLFMVEGRGLRNFAHTRRVTNQIGTALKLNSMQAGRFENQLDIGLQHDYIWLNQEPDTSVRQQIFAKGALFSQFSERFQLTADAALGLVSTLGEYQLKFYSRLDLGKIGNLDFHLLNQRVQPFKIHERMDVSFKPIWNQDLQKPIETSLNASYQLPVIGLKAGVGLHQINGFIYHDTLGHARQTNAPVQVVQFSLRQIVHFRPFFFEYNFGLQESNVTDLIHLPTWMAKGSLTYRGYLFKKNALMHMGVSARINSPTQYDSWLPITGQFYLQNEVTSASVLWIDAYLDMKVKRFRTFFSYENLSGLWQKSLFYQTAYYPQHPGQIRFGIGWLFSDTNIKTDTSTSSPTGSGQGRRPF
jgi:hypothetical protein